MQLYQAIIGLLFTLPAFAASGQPKKLVLIRHAKGAHQTESEDLRDIRKSCSQPDPRLTEVGVAECDLLAQNLPVSLGNEELTIDLVMISPTSRTIETAMRGLVFVKENVPFILDEDLLEKDVDLNCNWGQKAAEYENGLVVELNNELREQGQRTRTLDFRRLPPDYPNRLKKTHANERVALENRVAKFLQDIFYNREEDVIAVVAHQSILGSVMTGKRVGTVWGNADYRIYELSEANEDREESVRGSELNLRMLPGYQHGGLKRSEFPDGNRFPKAVNQLPETDKWMASQLAKLRLESGEGGSGEVRSDESEPERRKV